MKKQITWGYLSNMLPDIGLNTDANKILNSSYCKTATSVYHYLCRHQNEKGAIFDPNILSTLDGQYHYANLCLSALILYKLQGDDTFYYTAYKSLHFYLNVPMENRQGGVDLFYRRGGVDLSNLPLLLSFALVKDGSCKHGLQELLYDYIKQMPHHAIIDQQHIYGNNFITMRAVNHLLKFKILEQKQDFDLARSLMDACLKWQFADGIFYDFPRDFNTPRGIPSLTYHAKMTLMTLLFGIISKEKDIIERAFAGLDALTKLMAPDGETFYYGRSNNALYGYACGLLAYRLASHYSTDKNAVQKYRYSEARLYSFIAKHTAEDGHLFIVPNPLENERCGFDSYMFVTVYNAFTMSMLLLSAIIKEPEVASSDNTESEVHYLKESGFIIKKSRGISTAINLKGHNYYQQYLLDPRYICGTPLFLKFNGHDILPTPPFTYPQYQLENKETLGEKAQRKIKRVFEEMRSWGFLKMFNPLHAGFIPYVERGNSWYLPLHIQKADVSQADSFTVIKFSGTLSSFSRRGIEPFLLFLCETIGIFITMPVKRLREMMVRDSNISFERWIVIDDFFVYFHDRIWGDKIGDVFFNFRTYADGLVEQKDNKFQFSGNGYGFVMLLEEGETVEKSASPGSSKGPADYWKVSTGKKSSPLINKKAVTLRHTLIPYDAENQIDESLTVFYERFPVITEIIQ